MTELRTPLQDGGEAISRTVTLDDGARFALLHVPGLFRYDVAPAQDTLRSWLRNLTDTGEDVVYEDQGSRPPIVGEEHAIAALGPRPLTLTQRFVLGGHSVEIVLLAKQETVAGRTSLTAQALVRPNAAA